MAEELSKRDVERIVTKMFDDKFKRDTSQFMKKRDIEKMIKKDIESATKEINKTKTDPDEVKDIIRDMMISFYKFMWEKSHFFIKSIK